MIAPVPRSIAAGKVAAHPKKLVVVGDSLVYGFGDPEGGGWVERLRRRSLSPHSSGPVIYNLGVRGDGVPQVAQRLSQEFRSRGELRNRIPDLLILSVGVNDSAQAGSKGGRNFTPFEIYQSKLDTLLTQVVSLCPVLFIGTVPVNEAAMPFAEILHYSHEQQYRYKQAAAQICQRRAVPYLDLFELWLSRGEQWWRSQLAEDGVHPNVSGHRAMLQDITNWQPFQAATDFAWVNLE